jgi:hypothetical protein
MTERIRMCLTTGLLQVQVNLARASAYRSLFVWLICLVTASVASAQGRAESYKARLSPLGVTNATVNTTTGVGSVTATLNGAKLTIDASFEGLTGTATAANLRRGPKGIPGPVVFDLEFPKTSSGKISAAVDLSQAQIEDLRAGRLYLQIHSERAPDGSIRGWLLK